MADKKISALTSATTPLTGTEVLPIVQSGDTVKTSVAVIQATPVASGTANGIQFLDGSKVPTTSGILTFDGTTQRISGPRGTYTFEWFNSNDGTVSGRAGTLSGNIFNIDATGASNIMTLSSNGTEAFRVDASANAQVSTGNLVIGTSGKGIDFSATSDAAGMTSELLDDYEEGTWTPTLLNGTSITYSTQSGVYTKIGDVVHVEAYISVSNNDTGDASNVTVGGLPFNPAGLSGVASPVFGINIYDQTLLDIATHGNPALSFASPAGGSIVLNYTYSQCNTTGKLRLSASYKV